MIGVLCFASMEELVTEPCASAKQGLVENSAKLVSLLRKGEGCIGFTNSWQLVKCLIFIWEKVSFFDLTVSWDAVPYLSVEIDWHMMVEIFKIQITLKSLLVKLLASYVISYAQTDAITPRIVGPRMLGVWQWCANECNNSQQHGTTCNKVCKRTQHVASNNVCSCWPTMLRRFESGHRYIAVFRSVWWSRDSPVVLQCCIAIEVTLLRFCFHLRYLCKLYISSTMSIKNSNNHNTCVHLLNSYNRLTVTTARLFKFLSRFSSQGHVRTAFSIPIWNICFMKPNTEMLCEEVKRSKDPWNERNIMTETEYRDGNVGSFTRTTVNIRRRRKWLLRNSYHND